MKRQTHSELHTHFLGMLSFQGLINLLKECHYSGFPIDEECNLDFENPIKRTQSIYFRIKDALHVEKDHSVEYRLLNKLYYNRRELLKDLADDIIERKGLDTGEVGKVRRIIHLKFLEAALLELIEQEVLYVEISFSNPSYIKFMLDNLDPSIKEKIDVRFMLSTDRSNDLESLQKDLKDIKKHTKNGYSIGFDFMGIEDAFEPQDLEPYPSIFGFEYKLDEIISILKDYPESALRIHAGETHNSRENPINTLRMIDRISKRKGIVIPPPEIRLGHAIYFTRTKEYVDLLKKFDCIVEFNASSNKALENISDFDELDYQFYLDNEIKLVLSTDGGGMYSTTLCDENKIAKLNTSKEEYKEIKSIDKTILKKKRKGGV